MIYLYTKFHIPIPNSSLVIAIIPKAKYRFQATAKLFYKNHLYKSSMFYN
jgi:hypothetical protein